ncbi:MAG: ABC transporter ATP-binding protein [Candidatus Bathyarchaeia archaeon]
MLKIEDVNVFYGYLHILHDVTLKLEKGEIVALIGANAAGKSTLIKAICGIVHPSSGIIEFLGKRIDNLKPFEIATLGISLVPEGRRLFPYMSVLENLEMGAYLPKARSKIRENIERVFNLFPILKERRKQLACTLSGGEQQMLAIGRALMSEPKLCILDEVSLGLSVKAINIVYKAIKEINAEGISLLLVEQNLRRSLSVADRGYVIEKGRIVWEGDKNNFDEDELRRRYFGVA